ncbi:DNA repair protein RecO [Chelativorans sp. Marseille-P2723]|uniref:DNA repair protein RecO n=1 Tax=Chelativorans sp. Marseille-P2723 TaxID=2709133 RepID=UPI00156E5455|nr:DNA repair protein RecO [Chelativorans sp. Marseille-P2723]
MEWRDEGIILGTRKHGEAGVILEAMTAAHGRHLGLVRGGRSRRMQPVLQPGNRVELLWRARLEEHLGAYQVEPLKLEAARLMGSSIAVYGLQTIGAHIRLLPERDPYPALYETLGVVLAHLDDPAIAGALFARFELALLEELGFGLDIAQCALTGSRECLAYVSPRTGRAVTYEAGAPWRDKLLRLPAFLQGHGEAYCDSVALSEAFALIGFFLNRHVYEPRGIQEPEARSGLLAALKRGLES